MRNYWKNKSGISLLEVLISMIIMSLGILCLAPLMVLSIDQNSYSKDISVVTQLAKEKLETLEASDSLSTLPEMTTETDIQDKFTRTTYIYDNATDTLIPENRYKVSVIISWTNDLGKTCSSQMSTLIHKE